MSATARALRPHPPPRQTESTAAARRPQLWLCAYFPELALTVSGLDLTRPAALQTSHKGRPCLYAISSPARQAGVETGMTPAAATALCPELQIRARDIRLEQTALHNLADTVLAFSPWVSLDYPHALLLEISTCLTLFGGAEALRERVRQALQDTGQRPVIALAPSPAASELLARLGHESIVYRKQMLRSLFGAVRLTALPLDDKLLRRLARTGVQTLVDVWRLPRDGLARRYGTDLLRQLDALAGDDNRSLRQFHRPPSYTGRRDLADELDKLEHFFPAVEQLAGELADFLRRRDAAALAVELSLLHYRRPASRIALTFRQATRDAGHCCRLLREKLERTALPAPVLAIELSSDAIAPFQPQTFSLFDNTEEREQDWQTALEQLQTRLGHQALQYAAAKADHRPERAGFLAAAPNMIDDSGQSLPPRPVWLLPVPKPLDPAHLSCQAASERIESGWWDGASATRDYRIAYDRLGRKLWVFRDLRPNGGWYCHGLFG